MFDSFLIVTVLKLKNVTEVSALVVLILKFNGLNKGEKIMKNKRTVKSYFIPVFMAFALMLSQSGLLVFAEGEDKTSTV